MADKKGMDKYSLKITAYDFVSLDIMQNPY
jgi:hypothetical protein